jgi:hypothetical protein
MACPTGPGACLTLTSATSRKRSVAASQVSCCSASLLRGLGSLWSALSRQLLNSSGVLRGGGGGGGVGGGCWEAETRLEEVATGREAPPHPGRC